MQTESKTRLALAILFVAALMGLLADGLLAHVAWGINLPIWIGCLVGAIFLGKQIGGGVLTFDSAVLMFPMLLFGACFAWRDSTMLRGLDLAAIIVAAALVISRQTAPFWTPSIGKVVASVMNLTAHCAAGFIHLILRDIDWREQRSSVVAANARSATAGVLIALPLLAIFTVLFVRADAGFEHLLKNLMQINVAYHFVPTAIGTWIAGSYLRGVLVPGEPVETASRASKLRLGAMELNVALALINLLFATFVIVQAKYLFGTAGTVEATPGLTFSSYARRGFFELVTVALLVLPLLLAGDRLHNPEQPKRAFRAQSLLLVSLVFCIMVSAFHRMRLYQLEYGLTELRFYTVAFMFWIAVVFLLFCVTVLRDLRGLFAMSTVALGFAGIVALHLVNPDRWIARANLENARAGRRFDPDYLKLLSADAVPIVIDNADAISPADLNRFIDHHMRRLSDLEDIRSWNFSRNAARAMLANKGFAMLRPLQ